MHDEQVRALFAALREGFAAILAAVIFSGVAINNRIADTEGIGSLIFMFIVLILGVRAGYVFTRITVEYTKRD